MFKLLQYYSRYQGVRGAMSGLPGWAKVILFLALLPGIVALSLSLLAVCVSIAALLLLGVPVYRLLSVLTGGARRVERSDGFVVATGPTEFVEPAGEDERPVAGDVPTVVVESALANEPQRPRRQVDVRIVE